MPVMCPIPRLIWPLATVTEPRPAKSVETQPVSVLPSKSEPEAGNFPGVMGGGAAAVLGWLISGGGAGFVVPPAQSNNAAAEMNAVLGKTRSIGAIMPPLKRSCRAREDKMFSRTKIPPPFGSPQRQPPTQKHERRAEKRRGDIDAGAAQNTSKSHGDNSEEDASNETADVRDHIALGTEAQQDDQQTSCDHPAANPHRAFLMLREGERVCREQAERCHDHSRSAETVWMNEKCSDVANGAGN